MKKIIDVAFKFIKRFFSPKKDENKISLIGDQLVFNKVKINISELVKLFKQDLADDWFLDPIHFEDRFKSKKEILDYLSDALNEDGEYAASNRIMMNVPKPGGALRYSLETHFYDRIVYHVLGVTLMKRLDAVISKRVFSHRYDYTQEKKEKAKYLFFNVIEQWNKFVEYVRVSSDGKVILETDLQNYFENIRIEDLKNSLSKALSMNEVDGEEKESLIFCINSIYAYLKKWSFNGINGIPQNRDISSFLANIYMLPVDNYLERKGVDFYRYMDDIRVICNNKYEARAILKDLVIQLRGIGLNINSKKTRIILPGTEDHETFIKREDFDLEIIDSLINSRKKPIVAIGFREVRNKLIELINNDELESRGFRFCISRVCKIALCRDIAKPAGFFEPITKGLLSHLSEFPESSDQIYKYLSSIEMSESNLSVVEKFIMNDSLSIYSWQNYQLWKLLVLKRHITKTLLSHARDVVIKSEKDSDVAGATLYLGACGDESDTKWLIKNFSIFNNFYLQRHALIAIQTANFGDDIEDEIPKFLQRESIGIFHSLKKFDTPFYVKPPDPINYKDIIRDVSFYV